MNKRSRIKDIAGSRFGKLVVLSLVGTKNRNAQWWCRCDCGNEKVIASRNLRAGTKSCGCLHETFWMSMRLNIAGQVYGRLTVIEPSQKKGQETTWLCRCECGGEIIVRIKQLRSGHVRSCGCLVEEMLANRPKGKDCHLWKGGITSENLMARSNPQFKRWRNKVFERDNYICQKCYIKGAYLHAHHIYGFAEYELLRYEVKNGITFCRECHYAFHGKYGTKEFSKQDTEEFINKLIILRIA